MADVQHQPTHLAAVKPAAARAGIFLALAVVVVIAGAAWATDGFQHFIDFSTFSRWAAADRNP